VALAQLQDPEQLKAMGLCGDTLIILGDAGQGPQPVSVVRSLDLSASANVPGAPLSAKPSLGHIVSPVPLTHACLRRSQPVQCISGSGDSAVGSTSLVLCLPEDTVAVQVAASSQESWAWLQEAAPHSQGLVATTGATLATAPGGEVVLVMDSSEDSVGLAAKSWFNDSMIATQALLT
ncbi:unnamed protein product, partial [Ixodes pacificus]